MSKSATWSEIPSGVSDTGVTADTRIFFKVMETKGDGDESTLCFSLFPCSHLGVIFALGFFFYSSSASTPKRVIFHQGKYPPRA